MEQSINRSVARSLCRSLAPLPNSTKNFDPGQLDRNTFDGDCKIKRRPNMEALSLNIHCRISGSALSNHIFVLGSKIVRFGSINFDDIQVSFSICAPQLIALSLACLLRYQIQL
jgi:hypothetical protein